jgi:branched-subunit amino acid transport protein
MNGAMLYLAILVAGFLPTYAWRLAAVVLVRRINPDSAVLQWVRCIANALVAALVVRLIMSPPGLLAQTTLTTRVAGLAVAVACFYIIKRHSAAVAVAAGWLVVFAAKSMPV